MFKKNSEGIYQFEKLLEFPNLVHGFSTKELGNMSISQGDPTRVARNRKKFLELLSIGEFKIPKNEQIHSANIRILDHYNLDYEEKADGMITNTPGIALFILAADCSPFLFLDPVKKVIGLAHIGWRGAMKKITSKMIATFSSEFGSRVSDILVAGGPGLKTCCNIQNGPLEQESLKEWEGYIEQLHNGLYRVDVLGFIISDLVKSGIKENRIYSNSLCTKENWDKFFSWKTAQNLGISENEGRFAAIMALK